MKKDKNENKNHDKMPGDMNTKNEEINNVNEPKPSQGIDETGIILKLTEELNNAKNKIEQLEKETADNKDRLLRKAAEFENFKRRTENDQLNLIKYAAESLIIKLLPVIDDFERSLQHIDSTKEIESIKQGINLIYDKFVKVLDGQGVKKIDSIGKPFDVHYHEALLQRKVKGVEPHTVIDEVEKGYMYKDRVIRHAKVIVSEEGNEEAADLNKRLNENSMNGEDK
jgi:molecular chaperone GrpE